MPKVLGLDLETTGFEAPDGHRIIEVAILTYDLDTRALEDVYVQRIDPDRSIPAAATAVHGIVYSELVGQPKWEDVASIIKAKMDAAAVAVIHNAGFDGPFIAHELGRVGLELLRIDLFCTMENARWACPDGKYPKLEELCFALGVPFDRASAHAAQYDVEKTMACFWAGLDRGFYKVPALELEPA